LAVGEDLLFLAEFGDEDATIPPKRGSPGKIQ